jgi:pilus assembly protein Flp/PilA
MKTVMRRFRRDQRGQGMTEYIIIVALIAIAAIGIVTIFGENIRQIFWGSTEALTGETDVKIDKNRGSKAKYVRGKSLKTFGEDND